MSEKRQRNVTDILLDMEVPQPGTKDLKIKRLSQAAGEDVIVTVRELPYTKIAEIKRSEDMAVHLMLAGVTAPDHRNEALKAKYGAVTPAELIKSMYSAGEIEDISRQIEVLSGYRSLTLEEIKKN